MERTEEPQTDMKPLLQDLFNRSVAGLAGQGWARSVGAVGKYKDEEDQHEAEEDFPEPDFCLYRSEDGKRCAVGHLIPDDKYDPDMEDTAAMSPTIYSLLVPEGQKYDVDPLISFLSDLQKAHDFGDTPEGMQDALRRTAKVHDLDLPPELKE